MRHRRKSVAELARTRYYKSAVLSADGVYRYRLTRQWQPRAPLPICMLNPSDADAWKDDPTIRKCVGFAQDFGFGGIDVVNQRAYRTKSPTELKQAAKSGVDTFGPDNLVALQEWFGRAIEADTVVLAAWGANAEAVWAKNFFDLARQCGWLSRVRCLGKTQQGYPLHPLMASYDRQLEPYLPWSHPGVPALDFEQVVKDELRRHGRPGGAR